MGSSLYSEREAVMWRIEKHARVHLALGVTDMRKSIRGLSSLVEEELGGRALSGDLFVFCNRRRNTIKILYWNLNGFVIWHKRLDRDCFRWPEEDGEVREIRRHELAWLLEGLDISQAHQKTLYNRVV
jgi:transposase